MWRIRTRCHSLQSGNIAMTILTTPSSATETPPEVWAKVKRAEDTYAMEESYGRRKPRLQNGGDTGKKEPLRSLMRGPQPAEEFPVEALREPLCEATRAINDRVQAPIAICAQSVLAAATLAVQGHANIELPTSQT